MKGAIVQCIGDLVKSNFGNDKWEKTLETAGMSKTSFFTPIQNVDDEKVMKIIESVCKVANISHAQASDAFGDYWVNVYAPKLYGSYFKGANTSKELLLKMDDIHDKVTKNIPNALPPRFEYEWKNDKTLILKYKSKRGLIDILLGLVKGVGKYYKEDLKVTKISNDKLQVIFPH
ncbi:MAG: heme NO-binding domain-containing protein [Candidatus Methanoperedens sp.]|nr:heme NO-binding domain-containing protein [Candidatus Methanoperedens sp.]CAG1005183.1 hypothetical protein METP1_03219 [Methanosarcinales archaeon]